MPKQNCYRIQETYSWVYKQKRQFEENKHLHSHSYFTTIHTSPGMEHCKYLWAADVPSVVVHTHRGISFRCKKNEIVICDMNRTENHSKPGIEER